MAALPKPKPDHSKRYAKSEAMFRQLMKQMDNDELEHAINAVGNHPVANVTMQPHVFAAMAAFAMTHELHLREMGAV